MNLSIGHAPEWLMRSISRGGPGYIELRHFPLDQAVRQEFTPTAQWRTVYDRALELTETGDVCVGVAVRGRRRGRNEDAIRVNLLWADLDDGRHLLDAYPISPTLLVESSPGRFHAYWLLDEPVDLTDQDARHSFLSTLKNVQAAVGSDHVSDLARVLRMPGTLNWKRPGDPCMAVPIEFSTPRGTSA
jgi:hypothetical protein